jgi:twitching motility protein PilI
MTIDPLSILRHIEERCRFCATGLPQKTETGRLWCGVAFRIAASRMVAAMGEVVEILTYPELTVIPYTRTWVRGIANIRGRLLPVIDMNGYLHDRLTTIGRRTRVMVADCSGVYTGLIVDEVMGLRHFPEEACLEGPSTVDEALEAYVHEGFCVDGQHWGIFRLSRLVESPRFNETAGWGAESGAGLGGRAHIP